MLISWCLFCVATWSCILLYRSRFWGDPGACPAPDLNFMFVGPCICSSTGVTFVRPPGRAFCSTDLDSGEMQGLAMLLTVLLCFRCMYLLISRCHFCAATRSCILLHSSRFWGDSGACHAPDWNFIFAGACIYSSAGVIFVRPPGRALCFTDPDSAEIQELAILLTGTSCLQVHLFGH